MIPPFAVSFSSSLRTRTRSCRGVIFTVISLTSIQSIPELGQSTFCGSRPTLRAKKLPILLPGHFQVIRLLFLAFGFPIRALLFLYFHSLRNCKLRLCTDSLRVNDEPKTTSAATVKVE